MVVVQLLDLPLVRAHCIEFKTSNFQNSLHRFQKQYYYAFIWPITQAWKVPMFAKSIGHVKMLSTAMKGSPILLYGESVSFYYCKP